MSEIKIAESDIWNLIPVKQKKRLKNRGLDIEYIKAVSEFVNSSCTNCDSIFKSYVVMDHKNFADFMYSTFFWTFSPQGFRWWFKKVFYKDFVHPNPDDNVYYGRYTNAAVKQAIDEYNDDEMDENVDKISNGGVISFFLNKLLKNYSSSEIDANITIADIDGNEYHTITIGTQVWMVENLKTTKYNDGTSIPLVTDQKEWYYLTTPVFSFYENNVAYKNSFGALYNWYTVNTGKLAPTGWHVPTYAEWRTLEKHLIANGFNNEEIISENFIAKSMAATLGWKSDTKSGAIGNDTSKNNNSGFSALPCGRRDEGGSFNSVGYNCFWWSSTEYSENYSWYWKLSNNNGSLIWSYWSKSCGFSVRCIRD